ncbi:MULTISPECIES: flagellar assembly peptidoglycan hydrolase FlgJ [Paraburkholderia]|jgi:peptidoglycan hydrolase FlgJ|uniref:Peptidoglycan hydrolase FlgJ n=1 Tax=Paraburkholderia aspalathi TaxID=1324617 RepID=A0A1I7EHY3_9BURK|nr:MULTISPECIES: flagellar assembly peptidoglycan hydrolase FlgJ [Paraburkholderia]MCP2086368.1 flagellar protein FlgJ [Paraburkholderia sediminicola]MBK3820850.1 flagellar assembly peptidoglycan hydrolase FlgJ [Paraburkholderia aspalathi]MBK3832639.1 flagellar assembly peptidoglycan hydrolase FlgJ [Paraburkholderia aspalathi]MBK3841634.1 flagellar assembly peptidoglycan hydrolase FlgJ [Paraburkholderia aspalathi]MBK3862346.1 flagellar assembly peptidoglycan hydrolase FlgJ [Paraburkholderia as
MNSDTTNSANAANDLTQRFALDVQGFGKLSAQAKASPQAGMKMAAQQFDAVFTQMMLKSMRDATPQDGPFDSHDSATFTSMMDQQLSQQLSQKGIGVADAMLKQMMRNQGMQVGGASGAGGGLTGMANALGGGSGGDEGQTAALNALAKAYGNAQANGQLAMGKGYSANSALTPPIRGDGSSPKVDAFVDKLAESAQAASAATGIPARFIIGQAALESGWGKSEIRKSDGTTSHNVFGIKATKDWTGKTVSTVTTEYVHGKPQRTVEKFRAYDSYQEAMTDYASMLKGNPRYAQVINSAHDVNGFANGMQRAGYATDPHYAKKLMSIMQKMG